MHGKYPVWLDTARDGVKCTTMQSGNEYSTVQYSTVQYSTVQYSTVQYSTVHPSSAFTLMNLLRHHEHVSELGTAWSPATCVPPTCSTGGRGER